MRIDRALCSLVYCALLVTMMSASGCDRHTPEGANGGDLSRELDPVSRSEAPLLTHDYARYRKSLVGDVGYDLALDLTLGDAEFGGRVTIRFDLLRTGLPLTIDFSRGTVSELTINGKASEPRYNGWYLELDTAALVSGANTVTIEFRHPFGHDSIGLHRFQDPKDGRVYLHTYFEPYHANRLFPCFDQPDLKATWTLEVTADSTWSVITATREESVTEHEDGKRLWRFPQSARFSTYIFSLHAGPYRIWEDAAGDVPLRLFARQSLAEFVAHEEWLQVTRQGFAFFERYFDIPYPYGKYDQLLVPEFSIGGMENVASVTFNERFIRRGKSTPEQRERTANVVLHELAHMWFGDLVTMSWWNGLWLKESFATYMASLALVDATEFDGAWQTFFSRTKQGAYTADQLVTTHPIEVPVIDTDTGFANFDSITYNKGASALQQLSHYLGEETFRDGVRRYLKENANGNTSVDDFVAALARVSGRELDGWVTDWLRKEGVNTIRVATVCSDGHLESLELIQTAPSSSPVLREHRLQVALYRESATGEMEIERVVEATVAGASSKLDGVAGAPCPALVYPNHGDWAFVRVELDPVSQKTVGEGISRFSDPMVRSMLWQSLWDSVRDAELPVDRYVNLVLANLGDETDLKLARQVLGTLHHSLAYLHRMGTETSKGHLAEFGPRAEELLWNRSQETDSNFDLQQAWFDGFVDLCHSDTCLDRLAHLLDGSVAVPRVEIDQERRWDLLIRLSAFAHRDAEKLVAKELEADATDAGHERAIAADSVRPDIDVKRRWLHEATKGPEGMPMAKLRMALGHLFPSHQRTLHAAMAEEIFAALPTIDSVGTQLLKRTVGVTLLPRLCTEESVSKLNAEATAGDRFGETLSRSLRIAHQEDERCLRMMKLLH